MVQGRVGLTGIMRRTMEKMARCHGQDEAYVESRWGSTPGRLYHEGLMRFEYVQTGPRGHERRPLALYVVGSRDHLLVLLRDVAFVEKWW